jgi:hypothetical protein
VEGNEDGWLCSIGGEGFFCMGVEYKLNRWSEEEIPRYY